MLHPKKIFLIILSLMLILLLECINLLFLDFNISFNTEISILFWISVLIYSFIILSIYYYIKRIDLFMIFIMLSYPFLFGGHFLIAFNIIINERFPFRSVISNKALLNTSYFSCEVILCLFIGYLYINKGCFSIQDLKKITKESDTKESKIMYKVGLATVIISAIPFFKSGFLAIKTTIEQGYGYRIVEGTKTPATLSTIISGFFIYGVFAMYLSKKNKNYLAIFLLIIFFIIYTLQGSRISTFCYLTLFIYLYFVRSSKKFNYFKVLLLIMTGIIIFPLVSHVRMTNADSFFEAVQISLKNIWKNNIIISIFYEASRTFNSTAIVLDYCPLVHPYIYGASYISAFIYIIPNAFTGNFLKNLNFIDDVFSPYLTSYGGIGSSFVAEVYYNFGWFFGLIFSILIGLFWGWLSKKIELKIINGKLIGLYWYCQIYIAIVFMVRSDLIYRLRSLIWYGFPIIFTIYILISISKKHHFIIKDKK